MRCKRLFLLLALLALGLGRAAAEEAEPPAEKGDILVIYPEEADRRSGADNLSAIAEALLSLRYSADFVEARDAAEAIGRYDRVVWCDTAVSERMDASLLDGYQGSVLALGQAVGLSGLGLDPAAGFSGGQMGEGEYTFDDETPFRHSVPFLNAGVMPEASYTSGTLTASAGAIPLASGREGLHYIALTDYTVPFAKAVLIQEIAQWMWPYASRMHSYAQYVVLDAVYPFYDPYRLRTLVDYMVERKMNFVISVMPIYEHSDYPAMGQFCEVLRYAQANGGAVILHAPIVQNGVEMEELAQRLTEATCNYFSQDVYPLALEIPSEWLFREDLTPLLGRYRTLFLSDTDAFSTHTVREYALGAYLRLGTQQIMPALPLDETGVSHLARCSTAVWLDMSMTEDRQLFSVIEKARNMPLPMQSLWDMEQAAYVNGGYFLTWKERTLTVNGEQRFNTYSPAHYQEGFDYRRNEYYRLVANLRNQNYYLISISAAVLALFLALAVRSRRQMHRRFMQKRFGQKGDGRRVGG